MNSLPLSIPAKSMEEFNFVDHFEQIISLDKNGAVPFGCWPLPNCFIKPIAIFIRVCWDFKVVSAAVWWPFIQGRAYLVIAVKSWIIRLLNTIKPASGTDPYVRD